MTPASGAKPFTVALNHTFNEEQIEVRCGAPSLSGCVFLVCVCVIFFACLLEAGVFFRWWWWCVCVCVGGVAALRGFMLWCARVECGWLCRVVCVARFMPRVSLRDSVVPWWCACVTVVVGFVGCLHTLPACCCPCAACLNV